MGSLHVMCNFKGPGSLLDASLLHAERTYHIFFNFGIISLK
jgi:hypothetical protein